MALLHRHVRFRCRQPQSIALCAVVTVVMFLHVAAGAFTSLGVASRGNGRFLQSNSRMVHTTEADVTQKSLLDARPDYRDRHNFAGAIREWMGMLCLLGVVSGLLWVPVPAHAVSPIVQPAADLKIPEIPEAELKRRHTTPWEQMKDEKWYKRGKRAFLGKCAGCHTTSVDKGKQKNLLSKDVLESKPYSDPEQIRYVIRYGVGKMPGFAADCEDESDFTKCRNVIPLDEDALQDVQDFLLNRAEFGWKGTG